MTTTTVFDEIRERIESEKASKLKHTHHEDNGRRLDVQSYLAAHGKTVTGQKTLSGGAIAHLLNECIFDSSHTNKEACIVQNENGLLTYHCKHNSCREKKWKDAKEFISGGASLEPWLTGGNGHKFSTGEAREQKPFESSDTTEGGPNEKVETSLRSAVLESEEFIAEQMPEKLVYLDPWLTALSIVLITGSRGIGKSWFLLALLLAISKQTKFGPWAAMNSAPCLYLDGEMAAQDLQERLISLDQDGVKISPLHIYSDAYASSQGFRRANLLDPNWRNDMKSLLLNLGVRVWAVDNIASLTPGIDENSKQEWDPVNQWLLELRFNGVTTILAHHTNRAGGQRGTSGREDNIDISILLKQPEGYTVEDGASFIASFTKARIAIPHLSKITDTRFQMQQDPPGKTIWAWSTVKQQRNQQIIALYREGVPNNDIASELRCSRQNVGQVIRRYKQKLECVSE